MAKRGIHRALRCPFALETTRSLANEDVDVNEDEEDVFFAFDMFDLLQAAVRGVLAGIAQREELVQRAVHPVRRVRLARKRTISAQSHGALRR